MSLKTDELGIPSSFAMARPEYPSFRNLATSVRCIPSVGRRPSLTPPSRPSGGKASVHTLDDNRVLELRDRSKHIEKQGARRTREALGNLDQQLAEVAPFQQADQRLRGVLQTLDHVLAVFDLAAFDPAGHLAIKNRPLVGEFTLNETTYREALCQDLPHDYGQTVGPFERASAIVVGDQAADGDARKGIEQGEDRIPYRSADVFEIDIDAVRAGGSQLFGKVRRPVIDDLVETQLVAHEGAFARTTRDPYGPRPLDPGDLAHRRTDRPACRAHRDGFARLRLADDQQTGPGGKTRHAQHAEGSRDRRGGRIELSQTFAIRQRVGLPTRVGQDDISDREIVMAAVDHLRHCASLHHRADPDWRGVGLGRAHSPAHVGIEGKIADFEQYLTVRRGRDGRSLDAEVFRNRRPFRAASQDDADKRLIGHFFASS